MRKPMHLLYLALTLVAVMTITVGAGAAYASGGSEVHTCGDCHTSTLLGASSHDFHGECNSTDESHRPSPNDCHQGDASGSCDAHHDSCNESDDVDMAQVAALAAKGEREALIDLARRNGSSLLFNSEREAVQILDCGKHVIAHFPVVAQAVGPEVDR
jgi:hypothetical protein